MNEIKPVGYFCDHSDEPFNARTHHGWEWNEENGGHRFEHQPNTISSHTGPDQAYLKPEDRERRCPRATPVYAADVPALLAEADGLRAELAEQRRYAGLLESEVCRCQPVCEGGEYLHEADCPVVPIQMRSAGLAAEGGAS